MAGPPESGTPVTAKRIRRLQFAVFASLVLGVSQPIFDQLVRSPEFLGAHRLTGASLWLFVAAVTLALPALAISTSGVLARLDQRAGLAGLVLCLFAALTLLVLVTVRQLADGLGSLPAFAVAGLLAAGAVRLHQQCRWAREIGVLAGWLAILVPVLFLLHPEIRLRLGTPDVQRVQVGGVKPTPVVLMICDELPVSTLMDPTGGIDADLFPGFASLAASSTWFRDALSPATMTTAAIPAITTSGDPEKHSKAELAARPTLFDLVSESHAILAYSAEPGFLPAEVPRLGDRRREPTWRVVMDDLRLLYLHLSMPEAIRAELPSVSTALGRFRADEARSVDIIDAIAALEPAIASASRPLFVYLHSSLPHHPWVHLPSGTLYWGDDSVVASGMRGVAGTGSWTSHPWPVAKAFRRHLLQAMFADELLARMLDHLQDTGLWNSALVVVTADHGASFEPGTPLRRPTPETLHDVAGVPLFVKLPGQSEARVDDRRASTLDVLPTVAEVLGIPEPWPLDGRSLLSEAVADRRRTVRHDDRSSLPADGDVLPRLIHTAQERRSLFSSHGQRLDPFRIGPYSQLVGRRVEEFPIAPSRWSAERTSRPPSEDWIEARLEFEIQGLEVTRPMAFAVVLDGTIRATSAVFPGATELSVMLSEAAARDLDHSDLRLFYLDVEAGRQPTLREIATRSIHFSLSPDGRFITDGEGGRWTIDRTYEGQIYPLSLPGNTRRVLAWAADSRYRPPRRFVVFAAGRSVATTGSGIPTENFLDFLRVRRPDEQIFYVAFPPVGEVRYFVLGPDGRASELIEVAPAGSSTTKVAPELP